MEWKALKILGLVFSCAYIMGCAGAKGPAFETLGQPADTVAFLYVYRPSKFVGSGAYPTFQLGGDKCYQLHNGGFYRFDVQPGRQSLQLVDDSVGPVEHPELLEFAMQAGTIEFFKYATDLKSVVAVAGVGSYAAFNDRFVHVELEIAKEELVGTKNENSTVDCPERQE